LEESILLPFDSEGGVGQRLGRQRRALAYPRDLSLRQASGAAVWQAKRFRVAMRPLGAFDGLAVKEAATGSSLGPVDSAMPCRAVVSQSREFAGHITSAPVKMQ